MSGREQTTSSVAKVLGIAPDLLRKWKARGLLKLAPQGVAGQGRSVECVWSNEAVAEARQILATKQDRQAQGGRNGVRSRAALAAGRAEGSEQDAAGRQMGGVGEGT